MALLIASLQNQVKMQTNRHRKEEGGRGGLRQHGALREDCHILKGDEEEERNTDVLRRITRASA